MCLAVYISAPNLLPLVAANEATPAFRVEEVAGEDPVRKHFSWPNVRYDASHQGCGCGFQYGQMPEGMEEDREEEAGRASVQALRAYVQAATEAGPLELYVCWEEEQGLPMQNRVPATANDLGGESFVFEQRRMLVFQHQSRADSRNRGGDTRSGSGGNQWHER